MFTHLFYLGRELTRTSFLANRLCSRWYLAKGLFLHGHGTKKNKDGQKRWPKHAGLTVVGGWHHCLFLGVVQDSAPCHHSLAMIRPSCSSSLLWLTRPTTGRWSWCAITITFRSSRKLHSVDSARDCRTSSIKLFLRNISLMEIVLHLGWDMVRQRLT